MHTEARKLYCILVVLVIAGLLWGCAANRKKDGFFEKWSTLAEESKGHSPLPGERAIDIPDAVKKQRTEDRLDIGLGKPLPKTPITMRMRNADIKIVLRSLARAADQNIVMKSELKGEVTVDVTNTPWDEVFQSVLRSHGLTYSWDGNILRVSMFDDKKSEPHVSQLIPIHYAETGKLKDTLQEFLVKDEKGAPRGSVRVDEYSNSLIIRASRDDLGKIISMIEKIDRPSKQILIKANIVEATKDTARNLGVQWGGMYANVAGGQNYYITPGGSAGSADPNKGPLTGNYIPSFGAPGISGQGFGVNFPASAAAMTAAGGTASLGLLFGKIGGSILEVQLQALQSEGKVNILSSPSITTIDNQTAFTENGEKVPYVTTVVSTTGTTQEVKFEDAVLRLEIKPHVIDGKNLKMNIRVKKDEVDTTRTVQGNPFIIKKQTETVLIVQDGETIVISGLTKQRTGDTTSGIPGLKDIPLLGYLFRGEGRSSKMEEVLIFITPHILTPQIEAAAQAGKDPSARR